MALSVDPVGDADSAGLTAPITIPAVVSVHVGGMITALAAQRSTATGTSAVDAAATVSIVTSSALARLGDAGMDGDDGTEAGDRACRVLQEYGAVHLSLLRRMASVVAAYETGGGGGVTPSPSTPSATAAHSGLALGTISAVGGAIVVHDGVHPVVDASAAHAGLHYSDGDVAEEAGGDTSASAASRRPMYVTRVRFETDMPAFDQWFRFRLSRLTATTVLIITLFDVKLPHDPTPLACTYLPLGGAAPPLMALRTIAPGAVAVTGRRSSVTSLLQEKARKVEAEAGDGGAGGRHPHGEGAAASTLMAVVLRTSPVPVGLLADPRYIFSWGAIPCGVPPTWAGKGAVLGEAADEGVVAIVHTSRRPFCASKLLPLFAYDAAGRLSPPHAVAQAAIRGAGARGAITSPVGPATLQVHWRADTDTDPTGARGALILRSVGIGEVHPLAELPVPYLRSLGMACSPHTDKYQDVASVLPVLEPLFRFMSSRHARAARAAKARSQHAESRARGRVKPAGWSATQTARARSRQLAREAGLPVEVATPGGDDAEEEEEGGAAVGLGGVGGIGLSDEEDETGPRGHGDDDEVLTGLDEQVFVGVCAHCTTLPEPALRTAFRQLDANGDKLLLWDEFVSYISRLLDNDLAKRAAQGTYLLIPPTEAGKRGAGKGVAPAGPPSATATASPVAGAPDAASAKHESIIAASPALAVVQSMLSKSMALCGDGGSTNHSVAAAMKPPSKSEVLASVEPARSVKADSDGVAQVCLAPELQGMVVAYRNHSVRVLDDGFREAMEVDLTAGLNLLNDVLPPALLSDMTPSTREEMAAALGGGEGGTALPIHAMDWVGEGACLLAVLCADRRVRVYDLRRYVSHGSSSLKDIVSRRVNAEVVRLQNEYDRNLQSALVAESAAHRRSGLAELSRRARSLGLGRGRGHGHRLYMRMDPIDEAMRPGEIEKLPPDAFIMQAVLSVNISNPGAVRDEIDREARREHRDGVDAGMGGGAATSPRLDGAAESSGGGGAPKEWYRRLAATGIGGGSGSGSSGLRGAAGELQDTIDFGRGRDYLRLRSSKATGLSLAMGGVGSATSAEMSLGDEGGVGTSAASAARRLRQLTFGAGGGRHGSRDGDPRLHALLAASKGGGAINGRRIGCKLQSLEVVTASQFVRVRGLKDGMPTAMRLVALRLYARHTTGFDPLLLSSAPPTSANAEGTTTSTKPPPSTPTSSATGGGSPTLLVALVGDNKGYVSAHRVQVGGAASSSGGSGSGGSRMAPTTLSTSVKTPLASVACIVSLPARDSDSSSMAGVVLSSTTATVVVGGSGPLAIMSLALGLERQRLLAEQPSVGSGGLSTSKTTTTGSPPPGMGSGGSSGATLRLSVLRVLNSTTPFAHPHGVAAMAYCANERCLVTTGPDRKVLLWNVTDAARADAQIGQLGTPTAIASDRDMIVSIATSDVHNMVVTTTKGGRIEIFDPRTLACIQRVVDDATVIFTRGIVVDPYHLVLLSYGSHLRAWSIRETFLNRVNAAIAVAAAKARDQGAGFPAPTSPSSAAASPSATMDAGGGGGVVDGTPAHAHRGMSQADVTAAMARTPWMSIARGYEEEGKLIPKPPPTPYVLNLHATHAGAEGDGDEEEGRVDGGGVTPGAPPGPMITTAVRLSRMAGRLKEGAASLVRSRKVEAGMEAERAARRTSVVPSDVQAIHDLQQQLGGRTMRRGSMEAQLVANMLESLRNQGRSEAEEAGDDDDDDGWGGVAGRPVPGTAAASAGVDGRSMLAALYSRAFNQVAVVSRDGLVKVYDVGSGHMVLSFMADHGRPDSDIGLGASHRLIPNPAAVGTTQVQLTAATLDVRHRRLITGSVHGSVRVWNLANGLLLRNLIAVPGCEISVVAYHPSANISLPILAGTSTGKLAFWKDQGRIGDDTMGSGAMVAVQLEDAATHGTRMASFAPPLSSVLQAEEQERELLQLHVAVRDARVSIWRHSPASPAALLRKQKGHATRNKDGDAARLAMVAGGDGGDDDEVAAFRAYLAAMAPAGVMVAPTPPAHAPPPTTPFTTRAGRTVHDGSGGSAGLGPRASGGTWGESGTDGSRAGGSGSGSSGVEEDVTRVMVTAAGVSGAATGRLGPTLVDALTSPRYLSLEARTIISSARRQVAAQHGVALRDRTAQSPRSLLTRFPTPLSPRFARRSSGRGAGVAAIDAGSDGLLDDDLAGVVSKEVTADLIQHKMDGIIAVFGGAGHTDEGDAPLPPGHAATGHTGAVAAEALASYQRLAPRVVNVPELSTHGGSILASHRMPTPPSTASSRQSGRRTAMARRRDGGGAATSVLPEKGVALRADVVGLVAGGGVPVDGHLIIDAREGDTRLPPWAISVSSDGMLVHWSPMTERPHAWRTLFDPDIVTGVQSPAVITTCTHLPAPGVIVVGTLLGCLHVVTMHNFSCLPAGRRLGGGRYPEPMVMGSGGDAALGAELQAGESGEEARRRTAFYTLPISTEWNSVRRGAGLAIAASDVYGHTMAGGGGGAGAAPPPPRTGAGGGGGSLLAALATSSRLHGRSRHKVTTAAEPPASTAPAGSSLLVTRGVVCAAGDALGQRLLVGYEGGFVRLFATGRLAEDGWAVFDRPLAEWRAHYTRFGIASAECMMMSTGVEYFLTAGGFEVKVWSVEGHFVALFGQGAPWPAMFRAAAPDALATAHTRQADDMIQGFNADRRGTRATIHAAAPDGGGGAGGGGSGGGSKATCSAFQFGWIRQLPKQQRALAPLTAMSPVAGGMEV